MVEVQREVAPSREMVQSQEHYLKVVAIVNIAEQQEGVEQACEDRGTAELGMVLFYL